MVSDTPLGPFHTLTDSPITPAGWECLDGTLYVDGGGRPWLVFCHEWVQCRDGEIWAMELSKDLTKTIAKPVLLFRAADALGTVPITDGRSYVTDGAFYYYYEERQPEYDLVQFWKAWLRSRTGGF